VRSSQEGLTWGLAAGPVGRFETKAVVGSRLSTTAEERTGSLSDGPIAGRINMAGKTYSQEFDGSPQRLYATTVAAVGALGYTVLTAQPDAGVISFNSGRSFRTWSGQDMTATITARGSSRSVVTLGGSTAMRGNVFGGGGQVVSWGEKTKIANTVIAKVAELLPTVLEPGDPVNSRGEGIAAELERLSDLRDRGVISNSDFDAAKAKLLA